MWPHSVVSFLFVHRGGFIESLIPPQPDRVFVCDLKQGDCLPGNGRQYGQGQGLHTKAIDQIVKICGQARQLFTGHGGLLNSVCTLLGYVADCY